MSETKLNPTHLFISYASEDAALAKWLARKLAALGYAVWFDQLKMLGGEPWPQTIDDAIKNRTFRMLGLISVNSLNKPKPTGERTLAQKIGEQRAISDFLIPLKLDSTELDWLTTAISYIPFNRGWADGWRQLLKKLDSISAPKTLSDAQSLAATAFPTGDDLIVAAPEDLRANVIRVNELPTSLRVLQVNHSLNQERRAALELAWPYYRISNSVWVSFVPLPKEFETEVEVANEWQSWTGLEETRGVQTRNIVANLIIRSLKARLLRAGCCVHPKKDQTIYLPENFTKDGWLRFIGYNGKNSRLMIRGKVTFKRFGKPNEINHHHFAFRIRLGKGLDKSFWIQISPSLFFFDELENPITDKRVGARRKRVCKSWFNAKWINRLLATEKLLLDSQTNSSDGIILDQGFHTIEVPVKLNEAALGEKEELVSEVIETTDQEEVLELENQDKGDADE
jgi:hypothetical protein